MQAANVSKEFPYIKVSRAGMVSGLLRESPVAKTKALRTKIPALTREFLSENPVVILTQKTDEFSLAASLLFKILDIPYKEIMIEPAKFGANTRPVFPEIYIGEEHIGSSLELFELYMNGTLIVRVQKLGISVRKRWIIDPSRVLQNWLFSLDR